ncbi:MAG: DUF1549 domain-containing protein, partial [Pirellula sp.]
MLSEWIRQGAEYKQHWAFTPVVAPEIPTSGKATSVANENSPTNTTASEVATATASKSKPGDAFIDAKLARHQLQRAPRAAPATLLRRLYFDLIGLPPTQQEVEDFEKAAAENFDAAWESQIDRLLGSEHYGERWARHWLDVVRYGETNSFERDGAKPHVWRYRDYVIRSLNEDKPYDQFLVEQLAGDEIPNVTRDSLIATGFYRLGIWDDEPADRELAVYEGFDDILTTVGQGILGLTINCCRCHDHKIDPIPTADYYASLAFFRNLSSNGYGPNVERPLIASADDKAKFQAAEASIREEGDRIQKKLSQVETELSSQLAAATKSQTTTYDLDDLEYRFYRETFDKLPDFDALKPETVAKLDPPLIDIGVATRPDCFGLV